MCPFHRRSLRSCDMPASWGWQFPHKHQSHNTTHRCTDRHVQTHIHTHTHTHTHIHTHTHTHTQACAQTCTCTNTQEKKIYFFQHDSYFAINVNPPVLV
ncbi:hypothetical protein AAFF_G00381770 [Aldrovandia affinis]|uniref:Uncharacterized protein n=1 Tax=Aldrovandia affinis TaxID=143900 RepID=A0AAD7T8A8_9TELE|nr:hypothetical protein AAFF_G00381770 [Aldrovandia affinis]